jgi:hypothetical protein
LDFINGIPGVDLQMLELLKLPRLAKGGIINRPTVAEIGEQGKEAVIPLENNKGWIKELAAELRTVLTMPTETREQTATASTNLYNEMVGAFKDALAQMKVELDDVEVGAFVNKTVADAIYT